MLVALLKLKAGVRLSHLDILGGSALLTAMTIANKYKGITMTYTIKKSLLISACLACLVASGPDGTGGSNVTGAVQLEVVERLVVAVLLAIR